MLDEVIQAFLFERKTTKLKSITDAEQISKIEETFHPENWIPDAAKRAKQLTISSHISKFTHSKAKTSAITAESRSIAGGFLRTGNVDVELDVFGNAAVHDTYAFLSLILTDGKTILRHLEENTYLIQQQLKLASTPFDELRDNFLAIKQDKSSKIRTSGQVKQVYFPVADDYHLLSVLTPSGLMFALKEKIIQLSKQAKLVREAEKNGTFDEHGFDELYDLTIMGFGGTKPQNISVLSSKFHGETYLLPCIPPSFKARNIQPPSSDFFKNSIYPKLYKASFNRFNYLVNHEFEKYVANNKIYRDERDDIICTVIDDVIARSWQLRQLDAGWSEKTNLPHYQKVWLDNAFIEERENNDDWLNRVTKELAHWFIDGYKKIIGKDAELLGDDDLKQIRTLIEENQDGLL
jgi:CRISPR-associated protein Csy1